MNTFLDRIILAKKRRLESTKAICSVEKIRLAAERNVNITFPFRHAIGAAGPRIIAEFKRASPSKGMISDSTKPAEMAKKYQSGGAAAISVLTEEDHFLGSLKDLDSIRNVTSLPILRKDFVIDNYQIYEAARIGASAILLIASILSYESLKRFQSLAHSLGLDVVIEVHDPAEMMLAIDTGAKIIGVNNRNLKTFEVSLGVSRSLIEMRPEGTLMISESGISSSDDIAELHSLGYDAFLIGETLMLSNDPSAELRRLYGEG